MASVANQKDDSTAKDASQPETCVNGLESGGPAHEAVSGLLGTGPCQFLHLCGQARGLRPHCLPSVGHLGSAKRMGRIGSRGELAHLGLELAPQLHNTNGEAVLRTQDDPREILRQIGKSHRDNLGRVTLLLVMQFVDVRRPEVAFEFLQNGKLLETAVFRARL